jgi:toxin-antitoxin system PIN domain toxin
MILPDVNVILQAFRRDSTGHAKYRTWLNAIVNGNADYGMSTQVLASVVRIASNPGAFANPSPAGDVLAFANRLLAQPNCRQIMPGARHWDIYTNLVRSTNAKGPLTQDAWLAAIAIEHGCHWVTADKDFARFAGLQWTLL